MSHRAYSSVSQKSTPQHEAILGRDMLKNNAGGFVFQLDDWKAFERFLILGSEGGSYYIGERKLTLDAARRVINCINQDPKRAVAQIVQVSDEARAPKNDPAIFALALAASSCSPDARAIALAALPKVCRIPTHLFHFIEFVQQQRGWGRGLKRAIQRWYNDAPLDRLAYQMVKYQSRDGFSHRDVLRLSHPKTTDATRNALYKWAVDGLKDGFDSSTLPEIVMAFEDVKANGVDIPQLIARHNLSREMLPTKSLNDPEVWKALLANKMPYTALLRSLGKLSAIGVLAPLSTSTGLVVERLVDEALIKKDRVHPVAILLALKTYQQGHGDMGKLEWKPNTPIIDALNHAFYLAFKHVEPTGKRILVGVDCSGSMKAATVAGTTLTAATGAAVMAMAVTHVEPNYHIIAFDDQVRATPTISKSMRLDEVMRLATNLSGSGTDCSVPMQYALDNGIDTDAFITITDNETWRGKEHVIQVLNRYRAKVGHPVKHVVIGMVASNLTINDPKDVDGLDVSGFDASVPAAIAGFIRS